MYLTQSGLYAKEEKLSTFVVRFESIISKENTNWVQYIKNVNKEEKEVG